MHGPRLYWAALFLLACDLSSEEEESTPVSTAEVPEESASTGPRGRVSAEGICTKIAEQAEDSEDWADWAKTMLEEHGECTPSVAALEARLDESYPRWGIRFLGVYDRCVDQSATPADYLSCVQEAVPAVAQRAGSGPPPSRGKGQGSEKDRSERAGKGAKSSKAGRTGKGGKGSKGGKGGKGPRGSRNKSE
jgi:hypothetical protein